MTDATTDPVISAFARHERIAFQFSGGRDSTAALYTLRDFWPRMQIYHLDTGDQFPETQEVVRQVERDLQADGCQIVRIHSDVAKVHAEHGLPSDLVPVDNTDFVGRNVSGRTIKIQGRYECCWRALMLPMHQRMVADGITLIVRGQRDEDYVTPPMRSGESQVGIEVLYPIQHWTGDEVQDYLEHFGFPVAPYYRQGMKHGSDCLSCTAWWDEGRAGYLKQHKPEAYAVYKQRTALIRVEIERQFARLMEE